MPNSVVIASRWGWAMQFDLEGSQWSSLHFTAIPPVQQHLGHIPNSVISGDSHRVVRVFPPLAVQ